MNPVWQQLAQAYRQEEEIYQQVRELVGRQQQAMEAGPDPAEVLRLCELAARLMSQIADIEDAIEPAKKQWEQSREDPEGDLGAVLASIEAAIGEIARRQEAVQSGLLQYMQGRQQAVREARDSINVGRARRLYRAG
jgi:hypothetical protein